MCPKHRTPVPQTIQIPHWVLCDGAWRRVGAHTVGLSGICKPCRDALYAQLAAEYIAAQERQTGEAA
jgi:hypothetical protein